VTEVQGRSRIGAVVSANPGHQFFGDERQRRGRAAHGRLARKELGEGRIRCRREVSGASRDGLGDCSGAVADAHDQQWREMPRQLHAPDEVNRQPEVAVRVR
jgi:hypothetical protein